MGTINNIDAFSDDERTREDVLLPPKGVPQASPRKLSLLVVTIAYYPTGKLAYVNVSVGGILILLVAVLAGVSPWSQIIPVLKGLLRIP
jgi:hypothetical protein